MIILFTIFTLRAIAPTDDRAVIYYPDPLFDKYELSWSSVNYWIDYYDIQERDKVIRQICLETANLTSRFCIECNNLFGMHKPKLRPTTAIDRDKSMAVYSDFIASIRDYAIWQEIFYKGGDYYLFLDSHGYAEDPLYITKLKSLNQ